MNKLISTIVPCFNQSDYLEETLRSVYNQTYDNWECIIVNDGSTDDSEKIALKWVEFDDRFFYFYKSNGGLSSARNFGINKSKGDYIQFLDSDDLIEPEKFFTQLKDLEKTQISVCDYFPFDDKTKLFDPNRYLSPFLSNENYKTEIISEWEYRKSIPCHSVLFEKKLIIENNIRFNESLKNHEDWVFWVILFFYSSSITNNYKILAKYRIREKSMSNENSMQNGFLNATDVLVVFFESIKNQDNNAILLEKKSEILEKNKQKKSIKRSAFYKCYRLLINLKNRLKS